MFPHATYPYGERNTANMNSPSPNEWDSIKYLDFSVQWLDFLTEINERVHDRRQTVEDVNSSPLERAAAEAERNAIEWMLNLFHKLVEGIGRGYPAMEQGG